MESHRRAEGEATARHPQAFSKLGPGPGTRILSANTGRCVVPGGIWPGPVEVRGVGSPLEGPTWWRR
jgi:hypothetical protein